MGLNIPKLCLYGLINYRSQTWTIMVTYRFNYLRSSIPLFPIIYSYSYERSLSSSHRKRERTKDSSGKRIISSFFQRSKVLTLIISLPSLPITYFHFRHTQMVASDKLGALPFPIIYNGQRIGQLKCTGQNHVDFLFFYLYLWWGKKH